MEVGRSETEKSGIQNADANEAKAECRGARP